MFKDVMVKGKSGKWNQLNSNFDKTLLKEIFLLENNKKELILVDKNLKLLADDLIDESCLYNPLDFMYELI